MARDENRSSESEQCRKLFLGGITYNTSEDMLDQFYSQWGNVVDSIVMRDPSTKRSRGFGFVTFSTSKMVDDAMNARPHVIDGKTIDPKRAIPKELSQRSEANISVKKLYVSGIRSDHTEEMFTEYFGDFGSVVEVEIMREKETGNVRGFAFVSFDDYDAVDKAVLQKSHIIDGKRCEVKKALRKEDIRKAQQQDRDKLERANRSGGRWNDRATTESNYSDRGSHFSGEYASNTGYAGGAAPNYGTNPAWNPVSNAWVTPNQWSQGGTNYSTGYAGYGNQQQSATWGAAPNMAWSQGQTVPAAYPQQQPQQYTGSWAQPQPAATQQVAQSTWGAQQSGGYRGY